ncbi:MAG: chemotaxis protein CheW [Oligoflexia bacterium]|nr:chemotaxis protein CheW [Oligoflexia bacterium]
MEIDQELLNCFIGEATDSLSEWERICLTIDDSATKEVFDSLFRVAHNIKGASRAVGLEEFGTFVHEVEDIINYLRRDEYPMFPGIATVLLESQTILIEWLEGLKQDPKFVRELSAIRKKLDLLRVPNAGQHVAASSSATASASQDAAAPKGPVDELEALFMAAQAEAQGSPAPVAAALAVEEPKVEAKPAAAAPAKKDTKNQAAAARNDETIRVAASKLDELIQLIGELSIHQAIVAQGRKAGQLQQRTYQNAIMLSEKITKEIQGKALGLRMQPLVSLFQRIERVARDVARAQAKDISVVVEGSDVELDKTVIERITDPLVHIIRNAVDHGVEKAEDRAASGKPVPATVKISADKDSAGVCIKISEDGRGLNGERLMRKATEMGLIRADSQLSEDEIANLIFLPGLSTAEKVTDISGRGVGMDVVARAVQALGGTIDVKTAVGKGTTFAITLPTSLSIVEALIVEISRSRYAVPMQELSEIVDLSNFSIETTGKRGRMISLRGNVVPVENLHDYLPLRTSKNGTGTASKVAGAKAPTPGLVVREGEDVVVFEIDSIVNQQQVVVRQLSDQLGKLQGFSGCTILGDGEPGMIVSLPEITRAYLKSAGTKENRA